MRITRSSDSCPTRWPKSSLLMFRQPWLDTNPSGTRHTKEDVVHCGRRNRNRWYTSNSDRGTLHSTLTSRAQRCVPISARFSRCYRVYVVSQKHVFHGGFMTTTSYGGDPWMVAIRCTCVAHTSDSASHTNTCSHKRSNVDRVWRCYSTWIRMDFLLPSYTRRRT